jgi:hypothetical protein
MKKASSPQPSNSSNQTITSTPQNLREGTTDQLTLFERCVLAVATGFAANPNWDFAEGALADRALRFGTDLYEKLKASQPTE